VNTSQILYFITVASKPEELVETVRGQVTYQQWLEDEAARIRHKSGWPVDIILNEKTGEIALAHLRLPPK
jgi:hypothetical protein